MATLAPLRARTTGRPPASAATALPPRYRSHTATAVPSINARAIVTLTGMAPRGPAAPPREKFGRSNVIPAWWNRKKNTPPILSTSSVSGAPSGSAAVASQGMACASNTTITNARAALPTAFPHPEVSTSAPPAPAAAAGIAALRVVGDLGRIATDSDAGGLECLGLCLGRASRAGDDSARMSHAFPGRRREPGHVGHHRFGHLFRNELGRSLFVVSTDLPHQDGH